MTIQSRLTRLAGYMPKVMAVICHLAMLGLTLSNCVGGTISGAGHLEAR
jgi:hypothetical protein